MARSQNNRRYWRNRAERMRKLAKAMGGTNVAQLLLDLVKECELRAEQAAPPDSLDTKRANVARTLIGERV